MALSQSNQPEKTDVVLPQEIWCILFNQTSITLNSFVLIIYRCLLIFFCPGVLHLATNEN